MAIGKTHFRIIALALILPLLSVGVVPAKTVCTSGCGCCVSSKDHLTDRLGPPGKSCNTNSPGNIIGPFQFYHTVVSGLAIKIHNDDLQEEIITRSCNMEIPLGHETLEGSIPMVQRGERYSQDAPVLFAGGIRPNGWSFSRPEFKPFLTVQKTITPLYLQKLSLLI